jgi:hypothetical protein
MPSPERRGQTLAQMAIAWVLRGGRVTTALIGASRPSRSRIASARSRNPDFTAEELAEIDRHAREADINLWAASARNARGRKERTDGNHHPQSHPARLQSRPVDLPGRRDYYIATSTFEWYPGVQIHHSTDLVNWKLATRPLTRASQLDMRGNPDSCGIWAPCLSHADGLFWLVYTDVKRLDGNFKDAHNYIVTAPSIEGPWSDPSYVNSSGFDPSLFHDDDGRKWFVNMVWNHVSTGIGGQPKHPSFDGILLQEWDHAAGKLVGPVKNIFPAARTGWSRRRISTSATAGTI